MLGYRAPKMIHDIPEDRQTDRQTENFITDTTDLFEYRTELRTQN